MSIYRPSPQRRALLAILLLASVTVITLDFRSEGGVFSGARGGVGSILSPVRRGASAVISPITGFFSGLARSGSIRSENQRLREENAALRAQNDQLLRDQARVQELEKLNQIALPRDVAFVGARVFAAGPSTTEWTVEIDAGSSRGVAVGHPVVSGEGLVGKVITVRDSSAVVQLVTDPRFNVAARLEKTNEVGIAAGHGAAPMTLDLVEPSVAVERGERVFTAGGRTSGFPADLPVAVVADAVAPDSALNRTITLMPLVQVGRLQLVKVLLVS